ncbi:hypothetical protein QYM36_018472 [Artemia franciscana]|uniref:Uncharacterized protein n=1 Tax=Artemia franciscana TaxID=6661 RepID=A0AA88KTX7_ARTSF|nr:hypothetical protein QYM36_018472 [Artemia franciscana]
MHPRIKSCGTKRSNRMKGAILKSDASLKKKRHGSYDYRLEKCSEDSIVKWIDNKPVQVTSLYYAVAPVDHCQRWHGSTRSSEIALVISVSATSQWVT